MKRLSIPLIFLLLMGCGGGYRMVRVTGWESRSRVVANQYSMQYRSANDYWTSLMFSPNSPNSALYIPGYAYFQGVIYTPKNMSLSGQVRVIGAMAARESASLHDGAMVTTNPDALRGRLQPHRFRYQIVNWKEL